MAGDQWHKAFGDYSNTSFAELLRRKSPDPATNARNSTEPASLAG